MNHHFSDQMFNPFSILFSGFRGPLLLLLILILLLFLLLVKLCLLDFDQQLTSAINEQRLRGDANLERLPGRDRYDRANRVEHPRRSL